MTATLHLNLDPRHQRRRHRSGARFAPEAPVTRRAMELRLRAMRRALWPDS